MRYNRAMFRDDYVLRQVAQVTAVLAKLLGLTDAKDYAGALAALDGAYQQFAGLNLGLVGALPAAELIALARWGEMLDIGKLVVLGDLLQAEGDLYAIQEQTGAAADCHLKALEILLEVAASGEHNLRAVGPRLEGLQARLAEAAPPEDLRAWLNDSLAAWSALPELPA